MRRAWGRWMARVMVWLLWISSLGAPGAAAVQASFLLGLESYARGWTHAGEQLVEAAASDPQDHEARLVLGLMRWAGNRLEKAQAALESLLPDLPAEYRPSIQALLGRLLLELDQIERAEQVSREVVQARPDLILSQLTLGEALLAQGRTEEALEPLKIARTGSPGLSRAYLLEGQVLASLGRWAEAREVLEVGARVDPWSGAMQLELARVYEMLGEADRAAHAYRRASQLGL